MASVNFKEDTDHRLKAIISVTSCHPPCLPQTPYPSSHDSFPPEPWKPDGAVFVATERYNNEAWVSRTFFGVGFGTEIHCIATAPLEVFLLFLNQLRYCHAYKESSFTPWKTRYRLIGKLLSEGYIHLMRIGQEASDDATYYLVPRTARPLTCLDLYHEKRWDASLCCKECHKDSRELTWISDVDAVQSFTSDGGPEGRKALVCCRAYLLLQKDYYWGKKYCPHELPEHDY